MHNFVIRCRDDSHTICMSNEIYTRFDTSITDKTRINFSSTLQARVNLLDYAIEVHFERDGEERCNVGTYALNKMSFTTNYES